MFFIPSFNQIAPAMFSPFYLRSLSHVRSRRRLTGYGIHHCFARSMVDPEAHEITMFHNFYADYYTMAGIAVASCMALCPAVDRKSVV